MVSGYYWVFLLPLPSAGFGTSCGSSAGFPLSITSPHGDGSAPGFSPHGSSSWPWHVSVKHHSLANPTPWCLSDTSAPLSRCCPSDRTSLILLCTSIFSSHTAGCVLSCTTPQLKVTLWVPLQSEVLDSPPSPVQSCTACPHCLHPTGAGTGPSRAQHPGTFL